MAVDHSNCCDPDPAEATRRGDSEYELDHDPTLSSCCERDRAQQRFELRARDALRAMDRVDLRARLEKKVLGQVPAEGSSADGSESSFGDPESGSDEDSALLTKLRLQRLQGIQKAAPRSFGSGVVTTCSEAQAMEEVRQGEGTHLLCLTAEGDEVCQDLDEHLDQLAFDCRDTRFLRVILTRQSGIPPSLGIPHAPAILVFKEGALTAKALVARFTQEGTLIQEQVDKFMRQAGVARNDESNSEADSEVGEEADWREPCEICGRRYFHQHINTKPVYRATPPEQPSDDDS